MKKIIGIGSLILLAGWFLFSVVIQPGSCSCSSSGKPVAEWEISVPNHIYRVDDYYLEKGVVAFDNYYIQQEGKWVFIDRPLVVSEEGEITVRKVR